MSGDLDEAADGVVRVLADWASNATPSRLPMVAGVSSAEPGMVAVAINPAAATVKAPIWTGRNPTSDDEALTTGRDDRWPHQ